MASTPSAGTVLRSGELPGRTPCPEPFEAVRALPAVAGDRGRVETRDLFVQEARIARAISAPLRATTTGHSSLREAGRSSRSSVLVPLEHGHPSRDHEHGIEPLQQKGQEVHDPVASEAVEGDAGRAAEVHARRLPPSCSPAGSPSRGPAPPHGGRGSRTRHSCPASPTRRSRTADLHNTGVASSSWPHGSVRTWTPLPLPASTGTLPRAGDEPNTSSPSPRSPPWATPRNPDAAGSPLCDSPGL